MSEVKFTKGPWYVDPDVQMRHIPFSQDYEEIHVGYNIFSKNDEIIGCEGITDSHPYNANLIAAAPELYEALEKILNEYLDVDLLNDEPETMTDACRLARKALSKVRGEKND